MALLERKIDLTFTLGEGSFGTSGQNTVKISGLRSSVHISKAGGASMPEASIDVWGLTPSIMRQLSTLGLVANLHRKNSVLVEAGDDDNGMSSVFIGTIFNGYADYQASPQVCFHIEGRAGFIEALAPNPPTSVKGSADVATILSGLADQAGLKFENNGVQKRLSNIYHAGAARQQIQEIADAAGIEWIIDVDKLIIWNPGEARGGTIPLIDKDHFLQGYPGYTANGIMIKVLFNPNIQFGGKIKVQSSRPELSGANGTWIVQAIDYSLDANMPGGQWSMTVQAYPESIGPVVPTAS